NIDYHISDLNLNNVTIIAENGTGSIVLQNDLSGNLNNGTLDDITGGQGAVNITTHNGHLVSGTNTTVQAGTLTFNVADSVSLSGNFSNAAITATTGGDFDLTDTTSHLNITSIDAGGGITLNTPGNLLAGNLQSLDAILLTADSDADETGDLILDG